MTQVPQVGVAGVVLAGDDVLLIRRAKAPLAGRWSLPGGRLEWGETLRHGVRREILEESGLHVRPIEVIATLDLIVRDAVGEVEFHYVLVEWLCGLVGPRGVPSPGDDADEAKWVNRGTLTGRSVYSLDEATLEVIGKAVHRLETTHP